MSLPVWRNSFNRRVSAFASLRSTACSSVVGAGRATILSDDTALGAAELDVLVLEVLVLVLAVVLPAVVVFVLLAAFASATMLSRAMASGPFP